MHHTDNLGRTLQKFDISAAEGQNVAVLVVKMLQSLRSDNSFKLFWEKTIKADDLGVTEPCLPWQKKLHKGLTVVLQATIAFQPLLVRRSKISVSLSLTKRNPALIL